MFKNRTTAYLATASHPDSIGVRTWSGMRDASHGAGVRGSASSPISNPPSNHL